MGAWCTETAPVTGSPLLHSVFAINANNVLAVGDSGTIIQRTSSGWSVMTTPTTNDLRGVWAASATDAWAVGVSGTVLRFNGTSWSSVTGVTTSDIDAVWGSSSTDVWMVGEGTVTHWNGSTFSAFGFGGTLLNVGGSGPHDVWVCGENTNLHHFTTSFTTVNPGIGTSTFLAVISLSPSNVWASDVVPNKETANFNGSKWTTQKTGGTFFDGLSALSASDIWGAGQTHTGHWNGTAWTIETPFGTSNNLWSVTTTTGNAWVVGDNALIGHRTF